MKSSKTYAKTLSSSLVPSLPDLAFTRSGLAFNPTADIWYWIDGPFRVNLDFQRAKLPASVPLDSFKRTLLVFAKSSSASYLHNLFEALLHFLSNRSGMTPLITISAIEVSIYATRLNEQQFWRLGTLNVLLQKWVALGLPGVDPDCTEYLRKKRIARNIRGRSVRTYDPYTGPFSEAEYSALYKAVNAAYGTGELPFWCSVLTRLLFATGGRISQYASLKIMDFECVNGSFTLNLPQVKTGEAHSRVLFKQFDISPQTGRMIEEYIETLTNQGYNSNSALFPETIVMTRAIQLRPENDLFNGHCISNSLASRLKEALTRIAPPTTRLAMENIPISTRRFRYTFATRMVEEGASRTIVAERLGHIDLQNVDIYFEASPKIIDNIDKAMDAQLAPLAKAFKGGVVEDERHSTLKGAPGSRIIDFRISSSPVGSCGGKGNGCAFEKPVACYTCFKFEPWLDAPHEKVLARLMAEREKWSQDERLAAINDQTTLAVQEVIAQCALMLAQRKS